MSRCEVLLLSLISCFLFPQHISALCFTLMDYPRSMLPTSCLVLTNAMDYDDDFGFALNNKAVESEHMSVALIPYKHTNKYNRTGKTGKKKKKNKEFGILSLPSSGV